MASFREMWLLNFATWWSTSASLVWTTSNSAQSDSQVFMRGSYPTTLPPTTHHTSAEAAFCPQQYHDKRELRKHTISGTDYREGGGHMAVTKSGNTDMFTLRTSPYWHASKPRPLTVRSCRKRSMTGSLGCSSRPCVREPSKFHGTGWCESGNSNGAAIGSICRCTCAADANGDHFSK